ncbi:MAG TPA: glycoside hydrolase family 2 protein [Chthonomonadaceae bacterium]|nr:glycoside hydrolase family 2 protein [Chthonomonadaceae bacterium]
MSGVVSLNGTWELTNAEFEPDYFTAPTLRGRRMFPAAVPAPIHQVLMDLGLVEDPRVGLNSLKARWVEEQFWVYRHSFPAPEEAARQNAWLCFDRLELNATVWLNGQEVGTHANALRPACFAVSGKLQAGENLLVVRIESGLYDVIDRPVGEYHQEPRAKLTGRPWSRKPAYQCGWDWQERLMNVGILGDVRLEWTPGPRLEQAMVFAIPNEDLSQATVTARVYVDNPAGTEVEGMLRARVVETGQETALPVRLPPGGARREAHLLLENPRLWWPRGHGEQALYTVEVTLEMAGEAQARTRRTGVRRVEMDQSPHPVEGRYCILKINDRSIFCKGGNWVPADMLYSAVPAERTRQLVDLAIEANFNMLRIWGGGLYAEETLCDACDTAGMMLWHDLLFACSKYPGDVPEWAREARREVAWGVRELAHHPSLVVWCGNNEIEEGDWNWGYDSHVRTHPHYALFHHDFPRIVTEEDPSRLYWISSPWSPDYKNPRDPTVGDQHPWKVSLQEPGGADWWHYRDYVDRFPNEGGVLGASTPATLRQFLPKNEQYLLSPSWQHHDNENARYDTRCGALGHAYQTIELWLGRDPLAMEWEEYAFASALLQAEGLREYIENYRRRMFSSASAIFWMFNDSWPTTHTWAIVDYYLRRRLAYHPVRRAFQPVTVVVVTEEQGSSVPSVSSVIQTGEVGRKAQKVVSVYGINDTQEIWKGDLRCGLFALAGGLPRDESQAVTLPANTSTLLTQFERAAWESLGTIRSGAFALLMQHGQTVAQHRMFVERFKDLRFIEPHIELKREKGRLTLTSEGFAWGVCLDLDGERPLSDNCFDLLPGIPYSLPWSDALGEPQILRVGNHDAVPPVTDASE